MCPEYGATTAFFPIDTSAMDYLVKTGRDQKKLVVFESYLKAVKMFRNYEDKSQDPTYSQVLFFYGDVKE